MNKPTRHFALEEWSDYVRGTLDPAGTELMRRHLETGCRRCAGRAAALEAVLALAEADRRLHVPTGAMRSVKAIAGVAATGEQTRAASTRLRLLYDTDLAPSTPGTRSERLNRRLMYASEALSVDLTLDSGKAGGVRVAGEVVELGSGQAADVPVFLLGSDRRILQLATSNDHGGFAFRPEDAGSLRLCLAPPGRDSIEMPIPPFGGSKGP